MNISICRRPARAASFSIGKEAAWTASFQICKGLSLALLASLFLNTQLYAADYVAPIPHTQTIAQGGQGNKKPALTAPARPAFREVRDKWALIIGISKFAHPEYNLKFSAKDASDFRDFLVNEANFAPDHVCMLLDEQATRINIMSAFGDKFLPRVARPGDLVVIYVSTHGTPGTKDKGGKSYIVAYDTDRDYLFATGVQMDDLEERIKEAVKTDRALVILDTCYSGAAATGARGGETPANFSAQSLAQGTGHMVVCSSGPDERSWESKSYANGVFTHNLINALRTTGKQQGIKAAFAQMKDQVEWEVQRDEGVSQSPQIGGHWVGEDLKINAPPSAPRQVGNISFAAAVPTPASSISPDSTQSAEAPYSVTPSPSGNTDQLNSKFNRAVSLLRSGSRDEALKLVTEAAQGGLDKAQAQLGIWCYKGTGGMAKDESKAFEWFSKAAAQGNADAINYLGVMYNNGTGVPQNYDKAVEWYQKAVNAGDRLAMSNLARMYDNGRGVPKNETRAAELYLSAAEKGEPGGQLAIGLKYKNGIGVPKDPSKAVEWFAKSADQGNLLAIVNLAIMLDTGNGVSKDEHRAMALYEQGAKQGNVTAQYNLALMYRYGRGCTKDIARAVELLEKSAGQGFASAQYSLASMYSSGTDIQKDEAKAFDLFTKAANQGNALAQVMLGVMYERGTYVTQNHAKAFELYQAAANQGQARAQYNLAQAYYGGRGTLKNKEMAVMWFQKSAAQGDELAIKALKAIR